MREFSYTIKDELGIHARPAGTLVKEVKRFNSEIKIKKEDKEADLRKILAIMGLGIKVQDKVTISITGTDEEEAFNVLKEFFETNL